jgi:hypothetical protein
MKDYWGLDVQTYVFLTSALVGGEWSRSRPGRFTSGVRAAGFHWVGGWVDPRSGLDDMEKWKFLSLPVLELRPLGRPARSQSLYRLSYPGSPCSQVLRIIHPSNSKLAPQCRTTNNDKASPTVNSCFSSLISYYKSRLRNARRHSPLSYARSYRIDNLGILLKLGTSSQTLPFEFLLCRLHTMDNYVMATLLFIILKQLFYAGYLVENYWKYHNIIFHTLPWHDGLGIDNKIYWTFSQLVNTVHRPVVLSHVAW